MNHIINNIYIGNSRDSRDILEKNINPNGIQIVFNVASDLEIVNNSSSVLYLQYGMIDGPGNDANALDIAANKLLEVYLAGEGKTKIMVHCHEGISRSPTTVACLFTKVFGVTLEQAYVVIASKRPIIFPNKALIELARKYCEKK